MLPTDPRQISSNLRSFGKGFPGQPVFIIWYGQAVPKAPGGGPLTIADRVVTSLQAWQQSVDHRPRGPLTVPLNFVIYRAQAT